MGQVEGIRALVDAIGGAKGGNGRARTATVSRIGGDGTVYVRFPGNPSEMPVHDCYATVTPGDAVPVEIANGRAAIGNNATDLPASTTAVNEVDSRALKAIEDAATAATAAASAQASADSAATAAAAAQSSADTAATAAGNAQTSADNAATAAATADAKAVQAAAAAATADQKAVAAGTAASAAQADATKANNAANDALTGLSTVQDVVGVVEWAAAHSEQDMADFINSHLALTTYGLNVLLDNTSYRVHIGTLTADGADGIYIIDESGHVVTTLSESITFDSSRPQRIGNENAYVEYYDSDGDGIPDSIRIKADSLTLGGTSVADKLSTQGYSVEIAATATDTASGAVTLTATVRKDGTALSAAEVLRIGCVKWYRADTGARVGVGLTLSASSGVRYLARLEG